MTNTKDRNDCWLGMGAAQLVMECQDLCKQRDDLLAALERIAMCCSLESAVKQARAAISSMKESK